MWNGGRPEVTLPSDSYSMIALGPSTVPLQNSPLPYGPLPVYGPSTLSPECTQSFPVPIEKLENWTRSPVDPSDRTASLQTERPSASVVQDPCPSAPSGNVRCTPILCFIPTAC